MSQADPNAYPVTFFGKMLTFSRIKLTTNDFDVITAHLAEVSPNKDSQIPIIIDSDVEIDLKQLIDLLWEWGLQPIGITRGLLDEQANELRVAIFPADGKRMKRVAPQSRETDITNAPVTPITPMQARFAKQIENLKKGVVADDSNDNSNHDTDTEQNQAKSQKSNHETEQPKTDNNIDNTTSNTTNNTTDSKPTALEPKKNVLLKTQQTKPTKTRETKTETSPKAETGASTETDSKEGTGAGTTSPTTSKTQVKMTTNSQDFIEAPQALDRITSKVHEPMLRSGQNVNHVGGDLILMNSVNDGAEAITDNNLHVYGKGMGRLIAGATGDPDAKIFCQCFNPSLVSVAGTYMLRDNLPPEVINKAVQVSYKEDEGLVFKIMDDWSQAIEQNSIKASKH